MDGNNCPHCGAPGEGACDSYGIPDEMACLRRQLAAANEMAGGMRSEPAKYRGMEVELAAVKNDLERYTRPLTDEQMREASEAWERMIDDGTDYGNVRDWDSVIRATRARKGAADAA